MNLFVIVALTITALVLMSIFRGKPAPPASIDPSVIKAFRKILRQQYLMAVPTAAFLVWLFKYPSSSGALHGLLVPVAVGVVAGAAVFTYRNWRCPKCGAYLGRNPMYTGQCPKCSTALRAPRQP